jgi:DnaJ-class molecular chaperone
MAASTNEEKTGIFNLRELRGERCPECGGTGQLRIDSENINEHFEVEKQTVITECPRCAGSGYGSAAG